MSERSRLVALVAVCATIVYICTLAAQHHAHLQQLQHELSLTQLSSAATGSPAALRPPRSLRRVGGASAASEVG